MSSTPKLSVDELKARVADGSAMIVHETRIATSADGGVIVLGANLPTSGTLPTLVGSTMSHKTHVFVGDTVHARQAAPGAELAGAPAYSVKLADGKTFPTMVASQLNHDATSFDGDVGRRVPDAAPKFGPVLNSNATIKFYKHREQTGADEEQLPEVWDSAPWGMATGSIVRRPDLDAKAGKLREVWKVKMSKQKDQYVYETLVPARALAVVLLDGKFHQFNVSYETKMVPPRPLVNGMVLMDMTTELKVDTSDLKRIVWITSPDKGIENPRFMLRLVKMEKFDVRACKDDVTGHVYPYRVESVYVLKRKAA